MLQPVRRPHLDRRRPRGRRAWVRLLVAVSMVASALAAPVSLSGAAQASDRLTDPCLTPQVRETMISQGLPTYGALARRKTTLLKYFLSLAPGCSATTYKLQVTGGTAFVRQALSTEALRSVPLPPQTLGHIVEATAAAQSNGVADPVFAIPGDVLTPPGTVNLEYDIETSARLEYRVQVYSGGVVTHTHDLEVLNVPASAPRRVTTAVSPLRVLVVPMGDAARSYSANWPTEAQATLQNAMGSLSRLLPVEDGVSSTLAHANAGIRYQVADSKWLVNLGVHDEVVSCTTDPSGQCVVKKDYFTAPSGSSVETYCGSGGHFAYISQKLAEARNAWNSANPSAPAQRVLGVIHDGISRGGSTDALDTVVDDNCAEGIATVSGTTAWSRLVRTDGEFINGVLVKDTVQSAGGIMGVELIHTLGGVPSVRTGNTGYHSTQRQADAFLQRAYNLTQKSYRPDNAAIMNYRYSGWHDDNVLLEAGDWAEVQCVLQKGGIELDTGGTCPVEGSVGAVSAAAKNATHLAGRTDGTVAGTFLHTYVAPRRLQEPVTRSSAYALVYYVNGTELARRDVPVGTVSSEHGENHLNHTGEGHGTVDITVELPDGADSFAFVKKATATTPEVVLYGRTRNARPTSALAPSTTTDGAPRQLVTSADNPALSSDGKHVAYTRGDDVLVQPVDDTTGTQLRIPDAGAPSFAVATTPGRLSLAVEGRNATDGQVRTIDLDTSGGAVSALGERVVYDPEAQSVVRTRGANPTWSPSGGEIAIDINGRDVFALSTSSEGPADCFSAAATGCRRVTAHPDFSAFDPSWSPARPGAPDGVLAVTRMNRSIEVPPLEIWTVDPSTGALKQVTPDGESPDWGGQQLAFSRGRDGIVLVDADTFEVVRVVGEPGDTRPARSGDDRRTAFARPDPATGSTSIYLLEEQPTDVDVVASDDRPEDLRLDVFVQCPDGTKVPHETGLFPTGGSGQTRTFEVNEEDVAGCAGGRLLYRVTDGWQFADPVVDPTAHAGTARTVVSVLSPRPASSYTQHASVPLSLTGVGADGAPLEVQYVVDGPSGPRTGAVQSGARADLPAFQVPGTYTLTASATDAQGLKGETTVQFSVVADADADGLPASVDSSAVHPCYPAGADQDSRNSVTDFDRDVLVGNDDENPCTSSLNASIELSMDKLSATSNGNTINVLIKNAGIDLQKIDPSTVAITRLGGKPVLLRALSWNPNDKLAHAKFDRAAFQDLVAKLGLKGYVPVLVTASSPAGGLAGVDPDDPIV